MLGGLEYRSIAAAVKRALAAANFMHPGADIGPADTTAGTTFQAGTHNVPANVTLAGDYVFLPGAKLKPASGVTITITGSVLAGAYQIFDTSAGGHVDLRTSKVAVCLVEWWGVTGGDAAFSAAHAATNKPLIDEAILYCSNELWFKQPGLYSTTGHIIGGAKKLKIVGSGQSSDAVRKGIRGSGIPFVYAAEMPNTDPAFWMNYIFQNGLQDVGNHVEFHDISIVASDTTATDIVPLGSLVSTSVTLNAHMDVHGSSLLQGYFGIHLTLSYESSFGPDVIYIGNGLTVYAAAFPRSSGGAAIAMTVPLLVYGGGSTNQAAVVRTNFYGANTGMTGIVSGQALYQYQDLSFGGANINTIKWHGCMLIGPMYDGFTLDAEQQEFFGGTFEQIVNKTLPVAELGTSCWIEPYGSSNIGDLTRLSGVANLLNWAGGSQVTVRGVQYGAQLVAFNIADDSGAGLVFTNVDCRYTLGGGICACYISFTYPVTASGASAKISGLPLAVANHQSSNSPAMVLTSAARTMVLRANQNSFNADFLNVAGATAVTNAQLSGATIQVTLIFPILPT